MFTLAPVAQPLIAKLTRPYGKVNPLSAGTAEASRQAVDGANVQPVSLVVEVEVIVLAPLADGAMQVRTSATWIDISLNLLQVATYALSNICNSQFGKSRLGYSIDRP